MNLPVTLLWLAALVSLPGMLHAQPETGQPLPRVVLSGDAGGLAGGAPWVSRSDESKPMLLACVHPDRETLIEPLRTALEAKGPAADQYLRYLVYDTRASWKPDRVIAMGHWFKRLGQTIDTARKEGIVQALLVTKEPDRPTWTPVYDRAAILRNTWNLPEADVHLFVLDSQGRLRYYLAEPPGEARALAIATLLRKLG